MELQQPDLKGEGFLDVRMEPALQLFNNLEVFERLLVSDSRQQGLPLQFQGNAAGWPARRSLKQPEACRAKHRATTIG